MTIEDFQYVIGKAQKAAKATDNPISAGDERGRLMQMLQASHGQVETAARELGVSRATLYRMCKRYGIEPKRMK